MSLFSPRYIITDEIAQSLTAIERARGFLEAAKLSDSWVKQMSDRALLLEAHHTTHIEGTHLTFEQAELIWKGEKVEGADPDDVRELLNYRDAFEMVRQNVDPAIPVTEMLLREILRRLVAGVRGESAAPGAYRTIQNFVANSKTGKVIYTPPPPQDVAPMMGELVNWLNQPGTVHPVLVAGISQFQLVHIHPFVDGNGRTSRLLSTIMLYRAGYDFKSLFTLSEFYDRDRPAFYRALQSVHEREMDLTPWLAFFTNGLATQLTEVKARGTAVIRGFVLAKSHNLNDGQSRLLTVLLLNNPANIRMLEQLLPQVPRRTLQRHLTALEAKRLIVASGHTNKAVYNVNPEVLSAM